MLNWFEEKQRQMCNIRHDMWGQPEPPGTAPCRDCSTANAQKFSYLVQVTTMPIPTTQCVTVTAIGPVAMMPQLTMCAGLGSPQRPLVRCVGRPCVAIIRRWLPTKSCQENVLKHPNKLDAWAIIGNKVAWPEKGVSMDVNLWITKASRVACLLGAQKKYWG